MVVSLDMPDDYPWLPGSGKSTLGDLGELAARLGSIVTYDRRGSVYWLDGFESGLAPWFPGGIGTGWDVRVVNGPTFRGGFSCRLTAGSDDQMVAKIGKRLAPSLLSTYGFEVSFSLSSNIEGLRLYFQINTGVTKSLAILKMGVVDQQLLYYNSNATYSVIEDVIIPGTDKFLFHTAKIVIDTKNNQYVRALYNQNEYDLSDIDIWTVPDTTDPRIEITITLIGVNGYNGIAYIDDCIVTVGDP